MFATSVELILFSSGNEPIKKDSLHKPSFYLILSALKLLIQSGSNSVWVLLVHLSPLYYFKTAKASAMHDEIFISGLSEVCFL